MIFLRYGLYFVLFMRYGSGVDVPFCIFWKEIYEANAEFESYSQCARSRKVGTSLVIKPFFKHKDLPANRIAAL
eukprot:UN11827